MENQGLRKDSTLLTTLFTSGRLWWNRHEPIEGLGYRIKRVPLKSREDADRELEKMKEPDDE